MAQAGWHPGGCAANPSHPSAMQQQVMMSPGPPQFSQAGYGVPGAQPGPCVAAQPGVVFTYSGAAPAGPAIEVFVEVAPEVTPTFHREQDGTFAFGVPPIRVRLTTSCSPMPFAEPGLSPFKPYEEFMLEMPELSRVIFNPWAGMPPGGTATAHAKKRGAILEVSPSTTLDAKLKANSPFGTLVLEDVQVSSDMAVQQKIGETMLNYQLKVEGALSVNKGGGNLGSNRLEVDLAFHFSASLAGMSQAPMMVVTR
eukprot:TRINITY_DN23752_c0_g1_i1.p1 TRINITY_DN23752_c0_g1~~TRINITY_DN23752_c0_g1_i1.p1  ORF type:complete len:254 (+),score=47.78 TRINITY_DN23752_c0_g1_i1:60-821(+)